MAEGPPIQYRVGLDMDDKLTQLWSDYISESKDKFFWLFLNKFLEKWETNVIPSWELLVTSRLTGGREMGPELQKLPEELLPALNKYLFIGKDATEQGRINKESLDQMSRVIKALTVICLNIENIPLVGSMEFISHVTQLNTLLLQHLLEMESTFFSSRVHSEVSNQKLRAAIIATIVESCHFLETLYDPFFRWKAYLCGKDTSGLQVVDTPVSLHPVAIPFLYESFETALVDCFPEVGQELLTVFGSIISGAQHNAVKAICPATTKMILKTVRDSKTSQDIHINAIYCSSKSIRLLHETPLEERQIDLNLLVDQYQQILLSLTAKPEVNLATLVEGLSLLTRTLEVKNSGELQETFARRGVLTNYMLVVKECRLPVEQKRSLLPVVVTRISMILRNCEYAQNLMEKDNLYSTLFNLVDSCGPPDYNTLHAILAMSTHGADPTIGSKEIKNIQPIRNLLHWLTVTEYENHEQQVWLTECLYNLCVGRIQNKMLCCQNSLIKDIVETLKYHERLQRASAEYLLKLIEVLGQHSISAQELKLLIVFLQKESEEVGEEGTKFPFKSHIIHIISSMAKGSGFEQSRQFFDIQESVEGLSVPSIIEWQGPVQGFSFHAWLRLDQVEGEPNTRRQLYSLYTNSGNGLEAFFLPNGVLAVASAYKKEFYVTKCEEFPLNDGQWHSLTVCQALGKRPFGQSQLSIYIDGALRTQSALKYPTFTEPIAYCQIGSELSRASIPVLLSPTGAVKHSIRDNIKDALKSSGVFALPTYLKPANTDPKVQWTMLGMEDVMWGRSLALRGQLGLVYVFQDCLQHSQARILHALGANQSLQHNIEEDTNEILDMISKLVFNFSSKVSHNMVITNLAPTQTTSYDGHTLAQPFTSQDVKDVINCLGGIQVLFPILGTSLYDAGLDASYISMNKDNSKSGSVDSETDWELLPSSSFSDWKLERNPVSGFITLIKNMTTKHQVNQEQLMRGGGVAIMGSLLQKVETNLIDVNVLMASQLFVEILTVSKQSKLLYQFYHSILLDFRIWSRSEFHMQIGHIQFISTLVIADRKYFRKKFGVQFFLDVVRQHYAFNENSSLSADDCMTIRGAIFGLIKLFIQRDVNAKEVSALLNFMFSNRKNIILGEILDMLTSHVESKFVKDQLILLLFEPQCFDLIYCIILENNNQQIQLKMLRLISDLLRTSRVSNRHKGRMHLQQVGYLGFLYMRSSKEPPLSLQEVTYLTDNMLLFDHASSYQGILALCQHLQMASIEIKLEIARKLLTLVFSHSHASAHLSKQTGWEGCISRLLVKEIVQPEIDTVVSVEDVVSLGDEFEEADHVKELSSPTHYINLVTDTAKQYLPTHAGNAVKLVGDSVGTVADEAGKVLAGTSKMVKSNIQHATDKVSSTVLKTHHLVTDKVQSAHQKVNKTVKTANTILESVSDISLIKRKPNNVSSKESPQFLQNYAYEFGDTDMISFSSEDMSRSRETVCSSPTKTHESISEDEISFDMDHIGAELESLRLVREGQESLEEELVQLIADILFSILWRGTLTRHRRDQATYLFQSYGQIVASINLLALNNILYASHVILKRKLAELCLQALLSDIREKNQTLSEHSLMAKHIMEIAYDLVILDEYDEFSKKVSEQLLDGILGVLDNFSVFHEDSPDNEWEEMGKMAFNILLQCAENTRDLDFCAIAAAKLHSLVHTRKDTRQEEVGFLIYRVNKIMQGSLSKDDTDHYAFMVPIMKALLDNSKVCLQLTMQLPALNLRLSGCEFFDLFQNYCKEEEWNYFISRKIKPLHDDYFGGVLSSLPDRFNEFWGNSYEESKVAVHRRNREIGESKLQFITMYQEPFRQRLREEQVRFQNVLTQQRSNQVFVEKRWRILKRLLFGPRGAWGHPGECLTDHWMLGHNENMHRMRIKLIPNPSFNPHLDASAQRDNIKKAEQEADQIPDLHISKEALVSSPLDEDEQDLTEEDLKVIAKEQMDSAQELDTEMEQEKFLTSEECELVTMMSVIKGRFELTNTFIYFFDSRPIKEFEERHDSRWSVSSLREVYLRRFNLRKSALEFFLLDQTNFFLNFPTLKRRNKVYLKIWGLKLPHLVYHGTRSPRDLLKASGLTQNWVNREISNFEYLMQLNTIAGRSYNDLSQYPVFPWVLADYHSTTLDLGSTASFRDLSKPMGVQNSAHAEEIKQKYENFEDPTGTIAKFHYGTHYSNSAMVLHYMVRVEPFTSLHINLQSGRFDVADRQFHSLPQTWRSLMNNINDVKELIPEFFYFPDFLLNLNCFDLGKLQGKKQAVSDVILPPWAANVDDFIRQHRLALESEYVSAHLHEWIDLIFGYKQKGLAAVEAKNVFYYCCYEGAVNLEAVTDPAEREALEGMIQNFGQVPCQLLKEAHPSRISYSEHRARFLKSDLRRPDLLKYPGYWRPYLVELAEERNPVVFLQHPQKQTKPYLGYSAADYLVSVTSDCTPSFYSWLPYDKQIPNYFSLEKDTTVNSKLCRQLAGPFCRSMKLKPEMFTVTPDSRFLVYGGTWDYSIRVFSLSKGKEVGAFIRHTDVVSCVGMDEGGLHCLSGSADTTAIVWELNPGQDSCRPRSIQVLYGHDAAVNAVAISTCLDLAVTGSKDGTVNVHSIKEGQYMRTLRPPGVDVNYTVDLLNLSYQGHIIYTGHTADIHSLHVCALNGRHLASSNVSHRVTGLVSSGDNVLTGDENGDLTLLDLLTLQVLKSLHLQLPVQTVALTRGNSHILAPLRDGKLIVVGLSGLPENYA